MTPNDAVRSWAKTELARFPGVVGVAWGLKQRRGQPTDERAFRVYVARKLPKRALLRHERIPTAILGIPTDVVQDQRYRPTALSSACVDTVHHDPLVGGIGITNWLNGPQGQAIGTLGFFATMNGVDGPNNLVAVTNNHVLGANNGVVGQTVYQPPLVQNGSSWSLPSAPVNPIGKIWALPERADFTDGNYIDAAAVQLNVCVSSWCHCNCGISISNHLRGLEAFLPSNAITDVANANVGDTVYKVGMLTGVTKGRVIAIDRQVSAPGLPPADNNIEIQPTQPDCNGVTRMSMEGDSGAAVVNAQGQLVGLLYSASYPVQTNALACHIKSVLSALNVTAITTALPLSNPAVSAFADELVRLDGPPNMSGRLRARFLDSREGRRIMTLVDQYRHEVVHLVNHNRRVTVAWHRARGPAFLNRCLANARDPETRIPESIDGVSRAQLIESMARALGEHGSLALREVVNQHHDEVLAWVARGDSLHDLVDELAAP